MRGWGGLVLGGRDYKRLVSPMSLEVFYGSD